MLTPEAAKWLLARMVERPGSSTEAYLMQLAEERNRCWTHLPRLALQRWDETTAAGELCEAAKHGNSDKIELMISCGISVNAADYDKRSALHLACSVGNKAVCEQLISARANVNARDRWKNTPLRDAIREGHRELARWMHVHGAQLKMTRNDMAGELCEYAHKGDVESIKVLTTCGCDVDASPVLAEGSGSCTPSSDLSLSRRARSRLDS